MAPEPEGSRAPDTVPRRLGIFGGTFDPPHRGHVRVAADVADALELDEVLWIPSPAPPHKDPSELSPFEVRVEMVRAAVGADPRFRVSEIEAELPAPSYTVRTLRALAARYPGSDRVLILGSDQYEELDSWHEPRELGRLATLAVMSRGGERPAVAPDAAEGVEVLFVDVTPVDVSSTGVRRRVAEGGYVREMVPDEVVRVIRREGLYLPSP